MIFSIILLLFLQIYSLNGARLISNEIETWWHDHFEYNDNSPVQDNSVRASTNYNIRIKSTNRNDTNIYNSFVYMSIPRGGRQKWEYEDSDGAEFANRSRLTMSWSTFLYRTDVWIFIELRNLSNFISSIDDVVVRPTYLNFQKEFINNKTIAILVPYQSIGYRFSIEFTDDLFTTYNLNNEPTENSSGLAIHREPRNALLIFAESMIDDTEKDKYIPNPIDNRIYYVSEGEVNNLNPIESNVIFFKPGIYYMPWNYHALLSNNVTWIYFSPGAYVKGAFQFQSSNNLLKVTGFGIISGEKYVYEADVNNSYHHTKNSECWSTCIKALRFNSTNDEQMLDLHGITISEPSYHTFVVYGNEQTFHMNVQFYHQVGSWYWQTDGLEIYPQSIVQNSFFHSNDDVLKIYHSHVQINNIIIWKNENGPMIQWGWSPRSIQNVTIDQIDIIHNRIWWSDIKYNTCVLNSATYYADMEATDTADPNQWIVNLTISNVRSEGMNPCAMRIYSLSSFQLIRIENLWIEQWNQLDRTSQISLFKAFTDKNRNQVHIGNQSKDKNGLAIVNYTVGTTKVSRLNDNWQDFKIGRLDFDGNLWDNWNAF